MPAPGRSAPLRDDADAGGVDESPSAPPLPTTLVSPVTIPTPASAAVAHRRDDRSEDFEFQTLFEDEAGGQPDGLGPAAGKVVDGSVDGEVADVAAREEQRVDDVGVGGQGDAPAVSVEYRGVARRTTRRSECR